jgi:iron-sulfur cluster insertion protein
LAAAERMAREDSALSGQALRVYIEGKGCDGFYYGVSFDKPAADDVAWTCGSLQVVIDPESLKFMHGSTVNWVDDERGRGFLVENPNHRKFRGKFYRKGDWHERLIGGPRPDPTSSSQ